MLKKYLHHRRVCKRISFKPFGLLRWIKENRKEEIKL